MGNRASSEIELQCCSGAGADAIGAEGAALKIKIQSKKRLGEGAFGTVFVAKALPVRRKKKSKKKKRKGDDESGAVDVDSGDKLRAVGIDDNDDAATEPIASRRFACKQIVCKDDEWIISVEHEIKMHRLCGSHPNILPLLASTVVNVGRGVREYYLLLPLCGGGSIQDAIDAASPGVSAFTMKDCLEIFSEVAGGVQAMHDIGFCHRDIKPANILFLPNGRPQLMDLGSCALVREHVKDMKDAAMMADIAAEKSTPTYRAPELFDCTHLIPHCIGPETDVWSLGCLLYAMAFGRSPFEFGPRGSFERLAVMNASVHFARHTPGGLENQLWADHIGADPTQDVALAAEEVNRKIVQTPGFVRLVTRMLDPNPLTRLRLKEAVHMASWKVGEREGEEEVGASIAEEGEQNEPEHVDAEEEIEVRSEAIDMTDFAVDWETAVVETTPTKSKKKKKRKKKKKNKNADGPVGSDHGNGFEVDDGKGGSEGKETLEDSLTISEQELSMDEEDEFGDFATSPSPKGC